MRSLLVILGAGLVGAFVAASAFAGETPRGVPHGGVPPAAESSHATSECTPVAAVLPGGKATMAVPPGNILAGETSTEMLPGCQSGEPPACRGTCPPFNTCQAIRLNSLEICSCVGERSVCGTADPLCGGVCPPGLVCAGDVFGFGSCRCDRPLPKAGIATGPAKETSHVTRAVPVTTTSPATPTTTTAPVPPACEASGYPGCGGECAAGEHCVAYVDRVAVGSCGCFTVRLVGIPCRYAGAPHCDGVCPSGTTCMGDETIGGCVCFDVLGATCGFFGPPECSGECPAHKPTCREDGAGGCVCAP